jgi:hypothetical protein
MSKKLSITAFFVWLNALVIWQLLFNSHSVISDILWEIHTIFSSVIVFYIFLNLLFKDEILDFIKICFRIVFKVWLIIFIAFSMHNSFNQKGFVLTSTFIFGYLEGLIDINSWLRNRNISKNSKIGKLCNTKTDKIILSVITISVVHILCAFIALIFFSID